MLIRSKAPAEGDTATYLRGGDPARRFTDYYPAWLDNLAGDCGIDPCVQS